MERMKRNPYETDQYLNEYLLFHYGQPEAVCPFPSIPREIQRFHQRIFEDCLLPIRFAAPTRGLDIGCAVGRFTFELGRVVDSVLGIDTSQSFISAARRMAKAHVCTVPVKESGVQSTSFTIVLSKALQRSAVQFQVRDILDLPGLSDRCFHIVAAINLICRLQCPRQFITQLHRLVVPRGQLILASPFSWLESYTPRREWLTSAEVESLLRPHFRLTRRRDLPFLLREHRRKYQLIVSEVSVFVRRAD